MPEYSSRALWRQSNPIAEKRFEESIIVQEGAALKSLYRESIDGLWVMLRPLFIVDDAP